ncbi:hypothetical protein JCM11641_000428 [Rhodosporidiobolus odoratus]
MSSGSADYSDEKSVSSQTEKNELFVDQVDPQAEKRLLRKLDLIIIPQVTVLFLLNFIDRSAVGNANVAGFSTDLHLNAAKNEYNIGLMLFFVVYILGEIPSNLILKKVGSWWLAFLCFCFGVITIGSAWIKSFGDFLAVRLLLGLFEGGVIPGIVFLCSTYYRRSELAFRVGTFLSLGPGLSGAFGGLLAAGFLNVDAGSLHTWQKIFALEGSITAGMGIIFFFTLPGPPETTRYLTAEERKLAVQRLNIEYGGQTQDKPTTQSVIRAILNPFTWFCTLNYSILNVIVQGVSLFLPTIISGLGHYSTTETQLRTVPPYIIASLWAVFISYCAWKTKRHGVYIAGSLVLTTVGYIMFLASSNPHVLYGASFLTFTGAIPCGSLFVAWATANSGSPTSRAVTAAIVPAWGAIGSMVAPWVYLPKYKPRYIPGNSLNVACSVTAGLLAVSLVLWVRWENKQREAGRRDGILEGKTEEEIKELGHRHPSYRFME